MFWSSKNHVKVLIVEDDEDHKDLIVRALSKSSKPLFSTSHISSIMEMKGALDSEQFDVIILDLNLIDSRADETLNEIEALELRTPIVVSSSVSSTVVIERALAIGAQDYIEKSDIGSSNLGRTLCYAIERKKATAQIETQNRELRKFAHVVAHEVKSLLQTPLTVMSLIEDKEELEKDEYQELLKVGRKSLVSMSDFTTQMLSFSKLESLESDCEIFDLNDLLADVLEQVRNEFDMSQIELEVFDLPLVNAPKAQIFHVVSNLIRNSFKHAKLPDQVLNVKIGSMDSSDGFERVFVEDDGVGVPDGLEENIFQYFFSKASGSVESTGIGLGFCRQILRRIEGDIKLTNPESKGARFEFTLPSRSGIQEIEKVDQELDAKPIPFKKNPGMLTI